MDDREWQASVDPEAMLDFLRGSGRASERKLRLFGVACCRTVWSLFTDERCRTAVEVVERYADGLATAQEMDRAWQGVNTARDLAFGPNSTAPYPHRSWRGRATSSAAYTLVNIPGSDSDILDVVWQDVKESARYARDLRGKTLLLKAAQADLLRCIFDVPSRFREPLAHSVVHWNDGVVRRLAEEAYERRTMPAGQLDNPRLVVLADALEEAGCQDEEILRHLRQPEAIHVRGCFPLDVCLGKW